MNYRGWYTTVAHLEEMKIIRDSTPWLSRLVQRYNLPSGFPYVLQSGSHIVAPCISVVSIELEGSELSITSLEDQAEGMPTAKPVNFKTDISLTINAREIKSKELMPWKSPVFGWSKRNWISLTLQTENSFLIGVNGIPKQGNNSKTKKLWEALGGL